MIKILEIIPNLSNGGAERFVCELSNELASRDNIECTVLTLFDIDRQEPGLIDTLNKEVKHISIGKKKGFDKNVFFKLYKIIKNGGYNVVHAHIGAIKYIIFASLLLSKVKFIATIHSEAQREAGKNIDRYSRFFMFKTHRCTPVTISDECRNSFENFYGMSVPMIYNGVSPYRKKGTPT